MDAYPLLHERGPHAPGSLKRLPKVPSDEQPTAKRCGPSEKLLRPKFGEWSFRALRRKVRGPCSKVMTPAREIVTGLSSNSSH